MASGAGGECISGMKIFRTLILEDNLNALSVIMNRLQLVHAENNFIKIAVTVLSESTQVESYIHSTSQDFDLVLLDRDCCIGGSFHILDLSRFSLKKVIAISSHVEYNNKLVAQGVSKVCTKDFSKLEEWGDELWETIRGVVESERC